MPPRRRTQRATEDVPDNNSASNSGSGTQEVNPPTAETSVGKPVIRPFREDDMKEMKLLLGMSAMEPLQTANYRAYTHPLILSIWIGLSSIFIRIIGWWHTQQFGWLGWIPSSAAMGYPILFAIDCIQRFHFVEAFKRRLLSEDILDIESYYNDSPPSQFWVLEWNNRPIGYIGVDATYPDETLTNIVNEEEKLGPIPSSDPKSNPAQKKKAAEILNNRRTERIKAREKPRSPTHAVIRHFHVDRMYHNSGIQYDLIQTAIGNAFTNSIPKTEKSGGIQEVFVRISSLEDDKLKFWREVGFVPTRDRKVDVGSEPVSTPAPLWGKGVTFKGRALAGETVEWWVLTKERWQKVEQ